MAHPEDDPQLRNAARRLLSDPAVEAVFEHLKKGCADDVFGTTADDTAGRERAYQRYHALADIRATLHRMVQQDE